MRESKFKEGDDVICDNPQVVFQVDKIRFSSSLQQYLYQSRTIGAWFTESSLELLEEKQDELEIKPGD